MPVLSLNTLMNQYKIAFGVLTTSAATDTVATGLKTVLGAMATLQDDVATGTNPALVSVALSATAGSIVVKGWTVAGAAAGTFSKKVNWVAFGY